MEVVDENLAALRLLLDGDPMDVTIDPPLPEDGDCEADCTTTVTWSGAEASEGAHVLTVVAIDQDEVVGEATVVVEARIVDRSPVTAELRLDGVVLPEGPQGDWRFGCTIWYEWDTTGVEGSHTFAVGVADPFGRVAAASASVDVGDIPYATSIEITGEADNIGFGSLEVEAHLFDAGTGAFLGCSDEHSGLEGVDESNSRYPVLAWFQDRTGARVPPSALAGRNVRVDGADDPVGSSTAIPAASFATMDPMTFENLAYLELTAGRPY